MTTVNNTSDTSYKKAFDTMRRQLEPHYIRSLQEIQSYSRIPYKKEAPKDPTRSILVRIGDTPEHVARDSERMTEAMCRYEDQFHRVVRLALPDTELRSEDELQRMNLYPDDEHIIQQIQEALYRFQNDGIPELMSVYREVEQCDLSIVAHCHAGIRRSAAVVAGYLYYQRSYELILKMYESIYLPQPFMLAHLFVAIDVEHSRLGYIDTPHDRQMKQQVFQEVRRMARHEPCQTIISVLMLNCTKNNK